MILLLVIGLVLFVKSPWGQDIIVQKAVHFVSERTGTKVQIDRLYMTFSGDFHLEGLYLEDLQGDTLVYSKKLETGLGIKTLLREGEYVVSKLEWEGLRAKVKRDSIGQEFNFDFLVRAFVAKDPAKPDADEVSNSGFLPKIQVGPIRLSDFQIFFDDEVMGINAEASWQYFGLDIDQLDLNKMDFGIGDFTLSQSKFRYVQTKAFLPSEETEKKEEPALPLLVLDQLMVNQADWYYESIPDGIKAIVKWDELSLSLPEANLEDQRVLLKSLILKNGDIDLGFITGNEDAPKPETADDSSTALSFPDWWIEAGDIELINSQIVFSQDGQKIKEGEFNPGAVALSNFNFSANNLFLKAPKAGLNIAQLTFQEGSGFALESLQTKVLFDEQGIRVDEFLIKTAGSKLSADLGVQFNSLADFIEKPEKASIDLNLKEFGSNLSEIFYFDPELKQDVYIQELVKNGLSAKGRVRGNLSNIKVQDFNLEYGKSSSLQVENLNLKQVLDPDQLQFESGPIFFKTNAEILESFLSDSGLNLPSEIQLEAKGKGNLKSIFADVLLRTSDGNILINGDFQMDTFYSADGKISLENLDLGKILDIPQLDPISLMTEVKGKASGIADIEGDIKLDIGQLVWNGNDFSALEFYAEAKEGAADAALTFKADFLDIDLSLQAKLDSLHPEFAFKIDMKKLEAMTLGLTKRDIRATMNIQGLVEGPFEDLKAVLDIQDGYLFYDNRPYPVGKIALDAQLSEEGSSLHLDSDFLKGFLNVNGSFAALSQSLTLYFEELIRGTDGIEQKSGLVAKSEFDFSPTPFIDQLLLAGIEEMDTLHLDFMYRSDEKELTANVLLPGVRYSGSQLDSLLLKLAGSEGNLDFYMDFEGFNAGPVEMGKSWIDANFKGEEIFLGFYSEDDRETVLDVKSSLGILGDTLIYHIEPEGLIFNRRAWDVPQDNSLRFGPKFLEFHEFMFSRNGQNIRFSNQIKNFEEDHVGVMMQNFDINTFLGFLNPDTPLITGIANGELVVINPFVALGIVADLDVRDIVILEIPLGVMEMRAKAETLKQYGFLLSLKEGMVDMDLAGKIMADSVSSQLDLKLDLYALQMKMLEILSDGAVKEGKGYISADIDLKGSFQEPVYKGVFNFKEAGLLVSDLNASLLMPDEKIQIDNSGISLSDFKIIDENKHAFLVDGKILTENLTDPDFDLTFFTEDFQFLNSTREDNDLFFGKAIVDLDMKVKGSLSLPEINVAMKVKRGTSVTFIVPESQLELVERTGVVIFVNHQDPYDVMYQREMDISTKGLVGYDVRAKLQVDPQAVFNLIVDERTGDNLRLQGEADLSMVMNPNGNISLSGRYEVGSGHYELNLFGLVNRRFELAKGSTVIWNGDPMDASLNLQANYSVRTSASELMQAQLSGSNTETRGQFRQVLPFLVYLKIGGEILKPEITFELDLPEQDRGALGGSVYSMLQQINDKEDELTKQVFSLLVLNQFFPMGGNDGSSGGTVSLARSSVSQVLSNQMNALSDRLFGDSGFSLDFDLDSYTDYQSGGAQDRTQLNVAAKQSLMDERLVISVGGQVDVEGRSNQQVNQGDALFGDVSIEYLLDSKGQWRAKAYRRNQFESVIDGQLIVTGISFIFNKEFNAFWELWRSRANKEAITKEEDETQENNPE